MCLNLIIYNVEEEMNASKKEDLQDTNLDKLSANTSFFFTKSKWNLIRFFIY